MLRFLCLNKVVFELFDVYIRFRGASEPQSFEMKGLRFFLSAKLKKGESEIKPKSEMYTKINEIKNRKMKSNSNIQLMKKEK